MGSPQKDDKITDRVSLINLNRVKLVKDTTPMISEIDELDSLKDC